MPPVLSPEPQVSEEALPAFPPPPPSSWEPASVPDQTQPTQRASGNNGNSNQPPVHSWTAHAADSVNQHIAPLVVSGEVRSTVGATADDLILDKANGDLNERNFRVFSGDFRYNTFDPRVFSRFRLNLDTPKEHTGWQLHSNLTVDPWSFVGTTQKVRVTGTGGDAVDLQLKWWAPTNTAINEIFLTSLNGDSIATPEIETDNGKTVVTKVNSVFGNTFTIPALEVDYTFQPVRWAWTGYKNDVLDLRIFPLALQDQAMTSDDPLHLSNHHIYWEPSPWLDEWKPGHVNTGATPKDFGQGQWSFDLPFFTRDSDLTRLTALRGTSLQWQPLDHTSIQAALASPKSLWQEYDSFQSFAGMARVKQDLWDGRVTMGGTYTSRWAYNDRAKDADNNVYAMDLTFQPGSWLTWENEAAMSKSLQDNTSAFKTDSRGWAWHTAVSNSWFGQQVLDRFYYTHMDEGFDPGLAHYRDTRQDQFWGRHLWLGRQPELFTALTPASPVNPEDVAAVRIGDGVDVGRDAFGLRVNGSFFDKRFEPLFDVRNVHRTNGKYLETVIREENTVRPMKWLMTKTLFLYHDLPKTAAGIDPFVIDVPTDQSLLNTLIPNGRNPSLLTFSLGAELYPAEQFSFWGIWEHTNDSTIATNNFPRGLLNSSNFHTFTEDGQVFRTTSPFLFSQGFFPQPPYPYFDIFRAGVYYTPVEEVELALDWTRNTFDHAGQIDDNLNHVGLMAAWSPIKRLIIAGRYVMSWAVDITDENAGGGKKFDRHHSLFGRIAWKPTDDSQLYVEFGEAALGPSVLVFTTNPYGNYYPTLDTEHLVRLVYENTF